MLAVIGKPQNMAYEDRTALQHALRALSSHTRFPEQLKESSCTLYALRYEAPVDSRTSWGTRFLSADNANCAKSRTEMAFIPTNLVTAIADSSSNRLKRIVSAIAEI
jgi:hypothetical protein